MNKVQSEAQLEESLIQRLVGLGYDRVTILNNDDLCTNLKKQLEKHNSVTLSNQEFSRVLNQLDNGNVFDKAKLLRGSRIRVQKDNGEPLYLNLLKTEHWCQNQYQVTKSIGRIKGVFYEIKKYLMYSSLFSLTFFVFRKSISLSFR